MYLNIILALLFILTKYYAAAGFVNPVVKKVQDDYTEKRQKVNYKVTKVENDLKGYLCDKNAKYRNYDGTCNSLEDPGLGAAGTTYQRFWCDSYCDGVEEMPFSDYDDISARYISMQIYNNTKKHDCKVTASYVSFGQFIAHDMSFTQIGANVVCCNNGKYSANQETHPKCAAIDIPECDPVYNAAGFECMNFLRSDTDGGKPVNPINAVTAFLDGSPIYGNNKATAISLRTLKGGKMQSDVRYGKEWLPPSLNPTETCFNATSNEACYRAGDARVNQNTLLTLFHTLILRCHNHLAEKLCNNKDCTWKDERCFQEVRRIIIAILEKIFYYEYLVILLGKKYCLKLGLISDESTRDENGYYDVYSCDCDPSMSVECASAAFRGQHSAIPGILKLYFENEENCENKKRCDEDYFDVTGSIQLSPWMNKPAILEKGDNSCGLSRCLFAQRQEAIDANFDDQIRPLLFIFGNVIGSDLPALDVQRGRDHGLPKYCKVALECGVLKKCSCFNDIRKYISDKNVAILEKIYKGKVCDVELMVAGMVERKVRGTLVGPTFQCILGKQFWYTKCGDRFHFEGENQFTPEQLDEIRRYSMSSLICQHGDGVDKIQKNAFKKISKENPLKNCCDMHELDYSLFQTYD